MALDATYAVLNAFGSAILRYERKPGDRCSKCNSMRIQVVSTEEFESGFAVACESCGCMVESIDS